MKHVYEKLRDKLDEHKIPSRYGGKKSKKFWNLINGLPEPERSEAYSLGCVLQNIECDIRKKIGNLIIEAGEKK